MVFCLALVSSLPGQNEMEKIDSLWAEAKQSSLDTSLINIYHDLAVDLDIAGMTDSSMKVQALMLEKAQRINYRAGIAKAIAHKGRLYIDAGRLKESEILLKKATKIDSSIGRNDLLRYHINFLGILYIYSNEPDKAREAFQKVIKMADKGKDSLRMSQAYNNLGLIYQREGKHSKSARQFMKVLEIAHDLNDNMTIAHACSNLGISNKNLRNYDRAIQYHQTALEHYKKAGYQQGIITTLTNMALTYSEEGKLDSALYMNRRALHYKDQIIPRSLAFIYNNMGTVYLKKNDPERAGHFLRKALTYFKKVNSHYYLTAAYANTGEAYLRMNNLSMAEKYLDSALAYSDSSGAIEYRKIIYGNIAKLNERKGDYDEALSALKMFSELEDSLKTRDHLAELQQIEAEYLLKKGEKEKADLTRQYKVQKLEIAQEERKKQIIWIAIILLAAVAVLILSKYYIDKRNKNELVRKNKQYSDALNQLKHNKYQNEAILKALPDILFIFDPHGRYLDIKTSDESLLAFPRNELINKNISEILPPEQAEIFMTALKKALHSNKVEVVEYTLTIKNIKRNFEARLTPMDNTSVLCIVRDITDEKDQLHQLEKSRQALKEVNASKDRFFSIIAHDLKNPFNALIGFSSLLNEDFDDFTDEERREYIRQIYQASDSLFSLLENLLEWTKAQTGKLEFKPEPVLLTEVIQKNLNILVPEAHQKNIEIEFLDHTPENTTVYADKNMLTSIIRNLTANAIKFTHPGGKITITSITEGKMLKCAIADNGIGIDKEDQEKLFRIDSNVRKLGTHNEQGTGLGLLLCKEFTERQGGKIWVRSLKGKGTTFYFTIPLDATE